MRRIFVLLSVLFGVLAFSSKASAQTYYGHARETHFFDSNGQEVGYRIRLCNGQTVSDGTVTSNAVSSGWQACDPIYQSTPVSYPGKVNTFWYWSCTLVGYGGLEGDSPYPLYQCEIRLY